MLRSRGSAEGVQSPRRSEGTGTERGVDVCSWRRRRARRGVRVSRRRVRGRLRDARWGVSLRARRRLRSRRTHRVRGRRHRGRLYAARAGRASDRPPMKQSVSVRCVTCVAQVARFTGCVVSFERAFVVTPSPDAPNLAPIWLNRNEAPSGPNCSLFSGADRLLEVSRGRSGSG